MKKNAYLKAGMILSGLMLALLLLGLFWTPFDPNGMNPTEIFAGPSLRHLFGTDNFGRDIFSRALKGGSTTLLVAVCTVLIGVVVGGIIGALTGYFGGWVDEALMRINDTLAAFPGILLALVLISVLGFGRDKMILALGIVFVPSFARITRSEFARLREMNYVQSARLMGASHGRIMFRHILPNTFPALLPAMIIGFNNAVLAEAGMSFLNIGVQPPESSLGYMLSDSQSYITLAPWYMLCVGGMIVLLILGVGLLGEGLQRAYKE